MFERIGAVRPGAVDETGHTLELEITPRPDVSIMPIGGVPAKRAILTRYHRANEGGQPIVYFDRLEARDRAWLESYMAWQEPSREDYEVEPGHQPWVRPSEPAAHQLRGHLVRVGEAAPFVPGLKDRDVRWTLCLAFRHGSAICEIDVSPCPRCEESELDSLWIVVADPS